MNISMQISYIDMLDVITIKQNGYYYDQKDWINFGYWSWKNIADQVPNDYTYNARFNFNLQLKFLSITFSQSCGMRFIQTNSFIFSLASSTVSQNKLCRHQLNL